MSTPLRTPPNHQPTTDQIGKIGGEVRHASYRHKRSTEIGATQALKGRHTLAQGVDAQRQTLGKHAIRPGKHAIRRVTGGLRAPRATRQPRDTPNNRHPGRRRNRAIVADEHPARHRTECKRIKVLGDKYLFSASRDPNSHEYLIIES